MRRALGECLRILLRGGCHSDAGFWYGIRMVLMMLTG